jgi:hypothetical protein
MSETFDVKTLQPNFSSKPKHIRVATTTVWDRGATVIEEKIEC